MRLYWEVKRTGKHAVLIVLNLKASLAPSVMVEHFSKLDVSLPFPWSLLAAQPHQRKHACLCLHRSNWADLLFVLSGRGEDGYSSLTPVQLTDKRNILSTVPCVFYILTNVGVEPYSKTYDKTMSVLCLSWRSVTLSILPWHHRYKLFKGYEHFWKALYI